MSAITWSGAGRADDSNALINTPYKSRADPRVSYQIAVSQRHKGLVFRPGIIGGRTDDLIILALLNHMGAPARGPEDQKQRRKQGDGHPHLVLGTRGKPSEIAEH